MLVIAWRTITVSEQRKVFTSKEISFGFTIPKENVFSLLIYSKRKIKGDAFQSAYTIQKWKQPHVGITNNEITEDEPSFEKFYERMKQPGKLGLE